MKPLLFALLLSLSSVAIAAERPNVILMMADDMGVGDTSAYQRFTGNSDAMQVHTPNMERLARRGVLFTDAHTPSSRCTTTRYGLLTGRYPWRSRIKHWVLFGAQGDPMIERDRPTIATLLHDQEYRTYMVGKWHVGLRYRRADGAPAAGWEDADLTRPLFDSPLDHGFDECRVTSRSHGTSGPRPKAKKNRLDQTVGPGHIHGRAVVGAAGQGKKLFEDGPQAYVLRELGGRHSDSAVAFLDAHLSQSPTRQRPFFLYYACNSNHGPYTPDTRIGSRPVAGAARSVAGEPMNVRSDFIYENDVALGRLLDYLEEHDDPRRPGRKLSETTLVIFTSDNGAERDDVVSTGPFRSNKGSVYEGGHRVPFIVSYPAGGVGNGDESAPGAVSDSLISLQDLYATFADLLDVEMPDLRAGEKGAEDSVSVWPAFTGNTVPGRPRFFHDHKQAKDRAAAAMRWDDPMVDRRKRPGKWKLFFDARLLRTGAAHPTELYNLANDPQETRNRISEAELAPLVKAMTQEALLHRRSGGHRLAEAVTRRRVVFDWRPQEKAQAVEDENRMCLASAFAGRTAAVEVSADLEGETLKMIVEGHGPGENLQFSLNGRGLGMSGGRFKQCDDGEALTVRFDRDVVVESASIVAGNGVCGGFYQVADHSPLAIYCVDADNDANDQRGILSDIGVVKANQPLRLDTRPHLGVETPGQWRLAELAVRLLRR